MNSLFEKIWEKKLPFLGVFFVVFSLTYFVFLVIDFLPESPSAEGRTESLAQSALQTPAANEDEVPPPAENEVATNTEATETQANEVAPGPVAALPTTVIIERLEKTIPVRNPTSRTIADLDAALLEGVVRHPDSADLAQDGNIFILGHSSYLPNVMNRNYQAFNGIQNLAWGDTIEVYSDAAVFEYRVEKVYRARAQDVTVPIAGTGNKLTLATCNSFGSVDDRYIVEAKRVGTRAL